MKRNLSREHLKYVVYVCYSCDINDNSDNNININGNHKINQYEFVMPSLLCAISFSKKRQYIQHQNFFFKQKSPEHSKTDISLGSVCFLSSLDDLAEKEYQVVAEIYHRKSINKEWIAMNL